MKLSGKVALVTGAGRGIGKAIAVSLAEAGADIALADVDLANAENAAQEIRNLGRKALAIQVDVSQWDPVRSMVERCDTELGRLDILVNSAGVVTVSFVERLEETEWDRMMNINAKGVFLCCKAAIPYLRKQSYGRIINVASVAGKNGNASMAGYCASKFAVVGFTNSLAKELTRDDITVNAICPGIIRTAMWDYMADISKKPGETLEEAWQRSVATLIPQRRPQTPEDMGELAVYLATAKNVTGQAINVDGGMEMH
ncbi:MAG: SDR family oxidoreductase [Proteobacteria bacterium]|nr:SDR family oxidoreductase [Pseudomonadota bacterium]